MSHALLAQLTLTPEQVAALPNSSRSRLIQFLLRWEAYQEAHDCLQRINSGDLVSLQDMQARALEGLGNVKSAIQVMTTRIQQKESSTARNQLGRLYLTAGEVEKALAIATAQTAAEDATAMSWSFLGDVQMARGDLGAAEKAYLHHQKLAPNSRQPQMGLMRIHQRRGDPVSAAAYAVRAFTVNEGEYELPIYALRELRDFFAATGDENRRQAADEQLGQRFALEIAEMQTLIETAATGRPPRRAGATGAAGRPEPKATPPPKPTTPPQVTDLATIPVSETERAQLLAAAQQYFGFTALRPAQAEIMACALRGENVLTILPTGAGKSLCYQLPALLGKGVTLVVSPLIALMKDQVDNLPPALQRQAIAINSSLDGAQLAQAIQAIAAGRYKLVYAAPERLRQRTFLQALRQAGLGRLVIDEAHCVSMWGHDFRPDYLYLAQLVQALGEVPILALTATAPPRVRQDIERRLFGQPEGATAGRMRLIASDIYRPNLQLHAFKVSNEDEKLRCLLDLCGALSGSGIIYVRTRSASEEIAGLLRRHGLNVDHYHAGLANRTAVQERFMQGTTPIIVATVAFGMGIDKPDIRFIIHYGLPDSLEAYYQEVGRAGRDGQPSHCIAIFSSSDKAVLTKHANEGLLTKEFLRAVYAAVRARLNGTTLGAVALDDLLRDLRTSDDTAVRVALSVLEQVELLRRYPDAPRTVGLLPRPGVEDPAFVQFMQNAHLRPQQLVDRNYLALATAVQIAPETLEQQLLEWQRLGWLTVQASGRDLLFGLQTASPQVGQMIDSLLDQFATIQGQRVTEIYDYARSPHCRHGHLANYLGGLPRGDCGACDNCGAPPLPTGETHLPDDATQRQAILKALQTQSWGKVNLVKLLRGDHSVGERGMGSTMFGALAFRSETALERMIEDLTASGAVRAVSLAHGGTALELTKQGRVTIDDRR